MSLLLKGGSFLVVGGGACAIPFLNFSTLNKIQTVTSEITIAHNSGGGGGNSHTQPSASDGSSTHRTVEHSTQQAQNIVEAKENCLFQPDLDQTFIEQSSPSIRYFAFACDNQGRHEEIINSTWTIWIPEAMLREPDSFTSGKKVEIKTQSENLPLDSGSRDYHKTTFNSDIFTHNPIVVTWGEDVIWNESTFSLEEPQIYKVTIKEGQLNDQVFYLKVKQ